MISKGMLQTNKKSKNIAQKRTLTQLATNSSTRIGQRQFCQVARIWNWFITQAMWILNA